MGKKYKKSPIVEALCEFHFISDDESWDLTLPGLIYEKIKDKFPKKREKRVIDVQLRPTEKGLEHKIEPAPPRMQFYNEDETALIQIAPNLLVINHLKPYPTWEEFKKMILENFEIYKNVANPKGLNKIGLKYVNVIEFNTQEIELKDYFRFYPFIPDNLPKVHGSFLTRVEFPYEDGKEKLVLTLSTIVPKKPDMISILLDIDYKIIIPETITFKEIPRWLEKSHERIENAFESSITEKTKEIFEEEKDGQANND